MVKKIQDDQFLDLLTVKTEVRAVCKEPYRLSPTKLSANATIVFIHLFMLADIFDIMYILHDMVISFYHLNCFCMLYAYFALLFEVLLVAIH